jgi:hypothetical protein
MIQFRMSIRRYEILKEIARGQEKPIAQLINETLDRKLKLEQKATRKERIQAVKGSYMDE